MGAWLSFFLFVQNISHRTLTLWSILLPSEGYNLTEALKFYNIPLRLGTKLLIISGHVSSLKGGKRSGQVSRTNNNEKQQLISANETICYFCSASHERGDKQLPNMNANNIFKNGLIAICNTMHHSDQLYLFRSTRLFYPSPLILFPKCQEQTDCSPGRTTHLAMRPNAKHREEIYAWLQPLIKLSLCVILWCFLPFVELV